MPLIVAQGSSPENRWHRWVPPPGDMSAVTIGRSDAVWNVPWDAAVSRMHIEVTPLAEDRIEVRRLPAASNPVFFNGAAKDRFTVTPGEHFVIGSTRFALTSTPTSGGPQAEVEKTFDIGQIRRQTFSPVAKRIEGLSRLPDLIFTSQSDAEIAARLCRWLLDQCPTGTTSTIYRVCGSDAAVVHHEVDPSFGGAADEEAFTVPAIETDGVVSALTRGEATIRRIVNHPDRYQMIVPLPPGSGIAWVMTLSGSTSDSIPSESSAGSAGDHSSDDIWVDQLRLISVAASMVSTILESRQLRRRQDSLRRFFSPTVLRAVGDRGLDQLLEPTQAELTVLFCDLRNFTRRTAEHRGDLRTLLDEVSSALTVATRAILAADGVIGDFHGDAVMGFWGWPVASDRRKRVNAAIDAAIAIQTASDAGRMGFRCGVGIATGTAVAGGIGSDDQIKITALGSVVNLAARLQDAAKDHQRAILVDAPTAEAFTDRPPQTAMARLGRIELKGIDPPPEIYAIQANHPTTTR